MKVLGQYSVYGTPWDCNGGRKNPGWRSGALPNCLGKLRLLPLWSRALRVLPAQNGPSGPKLFNQKQYRRLWGGSFATPLFAKCPLSVDKRFVIEVIKFHDPDSSRQIPFHFVQKLNWKEKILQTGQIEGPNNAAKTMPYTHQLRWPYLQTKIPWCPLQL